jgi:hypothetical protein
MFEKEENICLVSGTGRFIRNNSWSMMAIVGYCEKACKDDGKMKKGFLSKTNIGPSFTIPWSY